MAARARAAGVTRIVCVGLWRGPGDFGNALALATADPGLLLRHHRRPPARGGPRPRGRLGRGRGAGPRPAGGGGGRDGPRLPLRPLAARRAGGLLPALAARRARGREAGGGPRPRGRRALRPRAAARRASPPAGGVIHCFTGDAAAARAYLALGLYVSVAGIVTFKTAGAIREAVGIVPRDRLLVETDSPYLAPVPYRGKRNEPAYVVETARKVAEISGHHARRGGRDHRRERAEAVPLVARASPVRSGRAHFASRA